IIVADNAVVRDVHSHHKKVARADPRRLIWTIRPVKRAELADDIVVADLEIACLTLELHILRLSTNHRVLEDAIARADPREALDDGMRTNFAVWSDLNVVFDHCKWTKAHVGANRTVFANNCSRVKRHRNKA